MPWIFASVVLVLLVLFPGFRKAGFVIAAITAVGIIGIGVAVGTGFIR